jgi:hypothetical protein
VGRRDAGRVERRSPSCRRACCCRTSPACPAWSTWRRCATRRRARRRPVPRQPAAAGRARHRSLRAGRHFGTANAFAAERGARVPAQPRALRLPALGPEAFDNFRVVPPETGIVHQVNIEYLARVVCRDETGGTAWPIPTRCSAPTRTRRWSTASACVGWGVGGIEAEAAMLGQPSSMLIPPVVGFRLTGRLPRARPPPTSC